MKRAPHHNQGQTVVLASEVQSILFPKTAPECSWAQIAFRYRMADEVGGDFFDLITMSDECQVIILGDVTGHGVHASLVMAMLYGYVHRAFSSPCPCRTIVAQINDFLVSFATRAGLYDQLFSTTMFYGIINPRTRQMVYVNAGHPAPLIRRYGSLRSLASTSPPLGYFDSSRIATGQVPLGKGDRMLFYTDGISETEGEDGNLFGQERLEALLLGSSGPPEELLDGLFDALGVFASPGGPRDDCTALVVDFLGEGFQGRGGDGKE